MSVTIFFKDAAEIPKSARIGTVISLHSAQSKKHQTTILLYCDVNIISSWCIYDPIDEVSLIDYFAGGFTFDENDNKILKNLRSFSKDYFVKHELFAVILKQVAAKANEKKPTDFDVLCLILIIKKESKKENLTLGDAEKVVKMNIAISRKLSLANHEVVRFRSANYSDMTKEFHSAKTSIENLESTEIER